MKSKRIQLALLVAALALLAAACSGPSRPASTPVVVPDGQATDPGPAATDAPSQVETLMAGELATQTAIAGGQPATQPSGEEPPPESTPVPTATTAPASQDPTAVPPTATPEPTDEPEPEPQVNCSSPYTVKKGDWVWNIGRSCDIHPNSIIAANNLVWPYTIYPGQTLILPSNAPPFP